MLTLQPVIQRIQEPFTLWPVGQQDTGWLRLHSGMTAEDVGMAVWALLHASLPPGDDKTIPETARLALVKIAEAETLFGLGGLTLADGEGTTIEPQCCSDISHWREWLDLGEGKAIFLGHSPDVEVTFDRSTIRVALEGSPAHVSFDQADLRALLLSAQRELTGFLAAARLWARTIDPELADEFVTALDMRLTISEPLPS